LAKKYGCQEQFLFLRGEDVLTVANQKQELLLAAIFVGQTERNEEKEASM
jgi:hypothetical protein